MQSESLTIPETLLDELSAKDWAVCPGFVPAEAVRELMADAQARFDAGEFYHAGIGKEVDRQIRSEIRGDVICWWDLLALSPAQAAFSERLAELRTELNRRFFLGIDDVEIHYARYEPGTFYQKHVDAFRRNNRRVFSAIFYLNEDWGPEDGGELLLYPSFDPDAPEVTEDNWLARDPLPAESVLPQAGLLACFLSERVPHEVKATRRVRWSVTMWFLRRA